MRIATSVKAGGLKKLVNRLIAAVFRGSSTDSGETGVSGVRG